MTDQTIARPQLWGPNAILLGHEDIEWSVWISGMDEILPAADLDAALRTAAELNASAHAAYDGHPFTPITHALVLYRGRAWQRTTVVQTTIPAEVAAHVLWQAARPGGYPPSGFIRSLLAAWNAADDLNHARLSGAYPAYGAALDLIRQPDGADRLRAIADA